MLHPGICQLTGICTWKSLSKAVIFVTNSSKDQYCAAGELYLMDVEQVNIFLHHQQRV